MGLMGEIGYEIGTANGVQRAVQRVAASRPGAWVFARTLHHVDRPLHRWSDGRLTVPSLVAGLPVVMLTTTGRRSGERRSMPLLGVPTGDDLSVIGSNFGQEHTPGWVYNLEADPRATIAYRDREVDVVARRAEPDEVDATFEVASTIYPGYRRYRRRADHREIRVFVLAPTG